MLQWTLKMFMIVIIIENLQINTVSVLNNSQGFDT